MVIGKKNKFEEINEKKKGRLISNPKPHCDHLGDTLFPLLLIFSSQLAA